MKTKRRNGVVIMFSLLHLLGPLSFVMVPAVLNGLLGNLLAFAVPTFGTLAVIKALGAQVPLSYGLLIGLTIGAGVLRGILRYLEQYSNHFIAFKILAILRDKVFQALRRLGPSAIEEKEKGGLLSLVTSDIETLEVFYAHTISPILIAISFSLIVFLLVYFLASPYLALVALCGYLFVGILLPILSSKLLKDSGVTYRKEFASFNSYFLDSIKGVRDLLLYGQGKKRRQEIEERTDDLLKTTQVMKKKTALSGALTDFSVTFFILMTLLTAILLVLFAGLLPTAAILGCVMVFSSFGPTLAIAALPGNLTQTFASGDRLLDLVEEKERIPEVTSGEDFSFENVRLKNVSFAYEDGKKPLTDVSLFVRKGEIVGIQGESGQGKSTLLKLLLDFERPRSGEVLYNGLALEKINTSSLRKNVSMVSQSTYLFDGTIEDNLRLAKKDATKEEMEEALREASLLDFVQSLEKGLETPVGSMGKSLSSGEKQRLGLARAFLRKSPLILLDVPTSNVDSINEGIILSSILRKKEGQAFLLVSHRASTMALCDRVYALKDGKLTEVEHG